jgi:hypothetical protein
MNERPRIVARSPSTPRLCIVRISGCMKPVKTGIGPRSGQHVEVGDQTGPDGGDQLGAVVPLHPAHGDRLDGAEVLDRPAGREIDPSRSHSGAGDGRQPGIGENAVELELGVDRVRSGDLPGHLEGARVEVHVVGAQLAEAALGQRPEP